MAFASAAGYNNLPQGNFSPVIYTQKVLKFFKTVSVADEVTNTEFEGEISQHGDTVRILKQPEVTVSSYTRGQQHTPQDLNDEDVTLTIDQANKYVFREDDIEKRHSHVSFSQMAVESGAYALMNEYDKDILSNMATNGTTPTSGEIGTAGATKSVGFSSADFSPLDIINRIMRLLDDNDVPDDGGRYIVAKPQFYEFLGKESSKYIEADTMGDRESFIRARKLGSKPVQGAMCYKTVNSPLDGSSNQTIIGGHISATATAKNILSAEVLRDQNSFADLYRGLFVWGRKVLRPEALMVAHITYS